MQGIGRYYRRWMFRGDPFTASRSWFKARIVKNHKCYKGYALHV